MGNFSENIFRALNNLSGESISGELIEISSGNTMTIQGSKGIIEYSDQLIRIGFREYELCIYGKKLTINCLTNDSLVINGIFSRLEWEGDNVRC